jgi:hypothetical protein
MTISRTDNRTFQPTVSNLTCLMMIAIISLLTNSTRHLYKKHIHSIFLINNHPLLSLLVNQPCGKVTQRVAKISSRYTTMKFVATPALFSLMKSVLHHIFNYIPS